MQFPWELNDLYIFIKVVLYSAANFQISMLCIPKLSTYFETILERLSFCLILKFNYSKLYFAYLVYYMFYHCLVLDFRICEMGFLIC